MNSIVDTRAVTNNFPRRQKSASIALTINGRPALQVLEDRNFFRSQLLGSDDDPATSTWQIEVGDTGETRTIEVTSTEYEINTVLASQTLINNATGTQIGYLAFDRFLVPSAGDRLLQRSQILALTNLWSICVTTEEVAS